MDFSVAKNQPIAALEVPAGTSLAQAIAVSSKVLNTARPAAPPVWLKPLPTFAPN
jgi:hypothetical protein